MSRPKLLDLFAGAGGCSVGYARAGFDVVGVDVRPQPNYPFRFYQADALTFPLDDDWAVVHASPPCQRYIRSGNVDRAKHPDLLGPVRDRLEAANVRYVLENVPGAPMRPDVILCGSMFGLSVRRHRWFESNVPLPPWTLACDHSHPITGVYGNPHGAEGAARGMLPGNLDTWSAGLGIDWMTTAELALAIPPAYCEHVGSALLASLGYEIPA